MLSRDKDGEGVMAAAARPDPDGGPARRWAKLEVVQDLQSLHETWQAFETAALLTPYQSFGWLSAYVDTLGAAERMAFHFVSVRSPDGDVLALLPFVETRRSGCRFAEFVGGKHANYHMGVFAPDFAASLDEKGSADLLRAISAQIGGLDAFVFVNQPLAWGGVANPLATLSAGASPSAVYKLAIEPAGGEATLKRSMSAHARKKLKHKRTRFDALGPWQLLRAKTPAEIDAVLDVFQAQKAERFRQMGVADPFSSVAVRAFLRDAALVTEKPAIELYGLQRNGRYLATYVGAVQRDRFSGMATSFDMNDEGAKFSPGEILLAELIALKAREGVRDFDLGVGEARYKTTFCDGKDELVDTFFPLTAKGRLFALVARAKRAAKRRIKGSPTALKLARRAAGLIRRPRAAGED